MSDFGGSSFASGAIGAGFNEVLQGQLTKIKDPALHQWASAVVGGAAAKVVGSNAQAGASAAASGTKNNYLTHEQYRLYNQELADLQKALEEGKITPEEAEAKKVEIIKRWSAKAREQQSKVSQYELTSKVKSGEFIYDPKLERSPVTTNKQFALGFAKGLKNKIDEPVETLRNLTPQQLDELIGSIPEQLDYLLHQKVVDTVGNVYEVTVKDWKNRYVDMMNTTDPEEQGRKAAELIADIGTVIGAARAAGQAVKEVQAFQAMRNAAKGPASASKLTTSTNPKDFLNEALKKQGLDKAPSNFKQKWSENGFDYEVRIHPAESQYGKDGSIYRVSRRQQGIDANGQGYGWEYMDQSGKWHHTSTLKPQNPSFSDQAARDTHIQLP